MRSICEAAGQRRYLVLVCRPDGFRRTTGRFRNYRGPSATTGTELTFMDELIPGRVYTDEEIDALHPSQRPSPQQPYGYDAAAPKQGVGHSRRSALGERWCPYCQTPLEGSGGSCAPCKVRREKTLERQRGGGPTRVPTANGTGTASRDRDRDLIHLLDQVDEMSRVIAVASAHLNRQGGIRKSKVEEMFMACKDVILAAEQVRDRNRPARP